MTIAERLASEANVEFAKTRKMLHAVPVSQADFKPHEKSMLLSRVAAHTAEIAGYGANVLEAPGFLIGSPDDPRKLIRAQQINEIIAAFEPLAARSLEVLAATPDEAFDEMFSVSREGVTMFSLSRYNAWRMMCINHMIHHRAQLGVYLRLLDKTVPSTFGPSADEGFDFSLMPV